MQLTQNKNENDFKYKIRLCKAKINKKIDIDWQEIVDLLGLNCHYDSLRKMAYGYVEYDNYINSNFYQSDPRIKTRILSISDTHVPFQLPIKTFVDYKNKVDILQLNGDILDCQSISKFPKTYRVSIMEEIIQGRQYIIDLIEFINPKKVVVNYGNHELRFESYLSKNLDSTILELMPKTALDLIFVDGFNHYDKKSKAKTYYEPIVNEFENIVIEYTEDWHCKIGKTIFCHPNSYRSGIMKTAERAMGFFMTQDRDYDCLVMSHTHQLGDFTIGNVQLYEQGTCADVDKLNYSNGRLSNPQQKGFLLIYQDKDGNLIKEHSKLIKL